MKIIPVRNKSESTLRIMLEPWTDSYDIAPGEEVKLIGEFDSEDISLEINYEPGDFLAIWVPFGTYVRNESGILEKIKGI